ncbi:hypothetical protein D1007_15595 [Hordeum vulgare]|nr:hypothetical protein D1007_15595 [Hordeum vulgare]
MDVRRLCRKNADTLRLAIQLSKREVAKEAAAKAKATHHVKEQDRLLRMLSSMRWSSDEDDRDASTSGSDDDGDDAATARRCLYGGGAHPLGRLKGEGAARK